MELAGGAGLDFVADLDAEVDGAEVVLEHGFELADGRVVGRLLAGEADGEGVAGGLDDLELADAVLPEPVELGECAGEEDAVCGFAGGADDDVGRAALDRADEGQVAAAGAGLGDGGGPVAGGAANHDQGVVVEVGKDEFAGLAWGGGVAVVEDFADDVFGADVEPVVGGALGGDAHDLVAAVLVEDGAAEGLVELAADVGEEDFGGGGDAAGADVGDVVFEAVAGETGEGRG